MAKINISSFMLVALFHGITGNGPNSNFGRVVGDPIKVARLIEFTLDFNSTITKMEETNQCSASTINTQDFVEISKNIFRYVLYKPICLIVYIFF